MSEIAAAEVLPECNCDHDFYDGTGINFHFDGSCPKGDMLKAVERVCWGLSWITGSALLTLGIHGGCFDKHWHWSWSRFRGYRADEDYVVPVPGIDP